ncbi:hypothetical protein [Corynebacterium heidelbergense]|uniref:Uncharacterized protein n=1 Tax=Corynebacterium heidelbergense TaxID=2055947 RepID=A0A364V7Q2_9CORY|nr:hypothetical protein [Corynebacterium heidelbergense]RAV32634.1 hypothetical protein DLJ54_02405 [Corynebacterium heidelbergense]
MRNTEENLRPPPALTQLLTASRAAAERRDIIANHRSTSTFACHHWLAEPTDVPDELRGEFYHLRAAAAEHLAMDEEAVAALTELRHWARERNRHAIALVAQAQLAYHALDAADTGAHAPGYDLPTAPEALSQVAEGLTTFRPSPDHPPIGSAGSATDRLVTPADAAALTAAATTAFTVATNLQNTDLAQLFATFVRRFGTVAPSAADRLLWNAQLAWAEGEHTLAANYATQALGHGPDSDYEAHEMLATCAMLEITQDSDLTAPAATRAVEHWIKAVGAAMDMNAPIMGIKMAELAARVLYAAEDTGAAVRLTERVLGAVSGAPVSPALLNLAAVHAQSLLAEGEVGRAWEKSLAVASWSEFTPDVERTASALAVAAEAGTRLGGEVEAQVLEVQRRRAEIYRQQGAHLEIADLLLSHYLSFPGHPEILAEVREALDASAHNDPHRDRTRWLQLSSQMHWHLADVGDSISDAIDHAHTAATGFHETGDRAAEALAWILLAERHVEAGDAGQAAVFLERSLSAEPGLRRWTAEEPSAEWTSQSPEHQVLAGVARNYRLVAERIAQCE